MNQEIIQHIANGAEIITPTQRLSRHLHHRYATLQVQAGKRVWDTPSILPWTAWCQREWQTMSFTNERQPVLLNHCQQQSLWQQVVQQSYFSDRCLHPLATARLAMQSYQTCKSAGLSIFPDNTPLNEDAHAFKTWAQDYEHTLAANHWVDVANLANHIARHISPQANRHIVFYGFDRYTAQQETVIAALTAAGCQCSRAAIQQQNQSIQVCAAPDSRMESKQAAQWAKQKLTAGPNATIGIVSFNLSAQRTHIEHACASILAPGALMQFEDAETKPYTLTLGRPLSEYGMVHTAMTLLALSRGKIPLHQISTVLLSPYVVGRDTERFERAALDVRLRQYGDQTVTVNSVLRLAQQQTRLDARCLILVGQFKAFQTQYTSSPKKQAWHAWAKTFSDELTQLGWPGDRPLNSDEYQLLHAWQDALQQLASLNRISLPVTRQAALSRLAWLVADSRFQPETAETPIQISGVTGAAGMQFDALWVLGMHDQQWPPATKPDPFIPLPLQIAANIPTASAKQQYELAQQITAALTHSAKEIVLSYAEQDSNQVLRPSPLLTQCAPNAPRFAAANEHDFKTLLFRSRQFETFTDDQAPAVPAGSRVRGGATLFKDQAACPFRAFARHRLHADSLGRQEIGLAPTERGQLVHTLLQLLWQRLDTSDALAQKSEDAIKALIHTVVAETCRQHAKIRPETFTPRFTQLEHQRLTTLMGEWLALERTRPQFRVVATEQRHTLVFNQIALRMQIDRIDETADGKLLIIDYKTGVTTVKDWETDRPNEPQLPLYAVTTDGPIAGMVFARVRRGDMRFIGLTEDNARLPNISTLPEGRSWQAQLKQWQATLTALAAAFRQGHAAVAPKNPQTCQYCDLHSLCRIHEKTGLLADATVAVQTPPE